MAQPDKPKVGDQFIAALESEAVAKKTDSRSKQRSLKSRKIAEVFHETQVPTGFARTWCVKVGDTCYDAAWSSRLKAWVYGGANSGLKG
jgi:hypothetical protein